MEVDENGNNDETSSTSMLHRKRRHRDSSDISNTDVSMIRPLTSLEILERAENPNFEELARQYPAFQRAWNATKAQQKEKGRGAAFSSCVTQEFTIALTRALLQSLFQLKLPYLDEEHLCPPVPNRFFYLHWIHSHLLNKNDNAARTQGLDVGGGASCIYSLLAARFYRSIMVTTDIDPKALAIAEANVKANHLSSAIAVLKVPPTHSQQPNSQFGGPLQRSIETMLRHCETCSQRNNVTLDFVMTNPPFYDPNDMGLSDVRVGDGRARTNMTVSEGLYPKGEVGFVLEMIEDSLRMSKTIQSSPATWYTSMLGKKTSLLKLQKVLIHILGPAHVEVTEYGPGQFTRWFLAWTLEQPLGNVTAALCEPHSKNKIQIYINQLLDDESIDYNSRTYVAKAMNEVYKRMIDFCESSPGDWDLAVEAVGSSDTEWCLRIQESMPQAVSLYVDETETDIEIPLTVLQALQDRDKSSLFLPNEGHFLIEASIKPISEPGATNNQNVRNAESAIQIALSCFRHSARGGKAIEKIRNTIEGEIFRTNRKWRKIRQRQMQQQQQQNI